MKQYHITGMSCAACSAKVEKAVSAVDGVTSCSVNLLTNSMGVDGTADKDAVIKAVVDAGYGASLKNSAADHVPDSTTDSDDYRNDNETQKMKYKLIASLIPLVPLLYVSMGNMLWDWPLPGFLQNNHLAVGIWELLLTAIIMVINQDFFIRGFKGLVRRSPNMDTLVALGATAAFGYSVYALFAMSDAVMNHDMMLAMKYMDEFYFESAATILTLITVGKMLEARSKGKTTDAIRGLMKLAPKTATLIRNGENVTVPLSQVKVGDRFAVRPGENIPVDGVVVEGSSAVNEASLTGESIPADKGPGDVVSAATTNQSGYLICEATRVGEDTTLSQIIQMVSDAAATKAPISKIADRVSGVFVPVVIIIACITFVVWLLVGREVSFSLARAISVLVISCPCALGLATPVAIMVGNGVGAKNGIMFKTAVSLEETGKAQIIALDKTGTITKGEPTVKLILPEEGFTEEDLLRVALALEEKSEHPLAKAIVAKAEELGLKGEGVSDFQVAAGNGLVGMQNGVQLVGGNMTYVSRHGKIREQAKNEAGKLAAQGMTPLFFAKGATFVGIIAVADVIKEDSTKAVHELQGMGFHVVMLTGDNEKTAAAIGEEVGVDEIVAGVLPDGKEAIVKKLQEHGKVIMVGDGINDAPALTRADMGIAIGAGTDVAIDAADVVLMKSSLLDVAAAIRLSRGTLRNICENLFWAFFYNVIGIPLAAGVWIHAFGLTLNPMFAAAAMSLSSFCVVSNALRLNWFKLYESKKDKRVKGIAPGDGLLTNMDKEEMEEKNQMKLIVNGMMCGHCEANVKKALEKIEGVAEATPDHNTNTVVLQTTKEVAEEEIKAVIEEAGYELGEIQK